MLGNRGRRDMSTDGGNSGRHCRTDALRPLRPARHPSRLSGRCDGGRRCWTGARDAGGGAGVEVVKEEHWAWQLLCVLPPLVTGLHLVLILLAPQAFLFSQAIVSSSPHPPLHRAPPPPLSPCPAAVRARVCGGEGGRGPFEYSSEINLFIT
jgi:hypothetical protein